MLQPALFQSVFSGPVADVERLDLAEERALIASAQAGDPAAVERLLVAYTPALRSAVSHFTRSMSAHPSREALEDIRSNAVLALVEAIHAFDPERHDRLAATAPAYIRDGVSTSAASATAFTVPERTLKRFFGIMRTAEGDVAKAIELAPEHEMKRETFLAVLEAVRGVDSFEKLLDDATSGYGDTGTRYGIAGATNDVEGVSLTSSGPIADAEDRILVELAFRAVDTLEKDVVGLAYGFTDYDPVPDAEIATRLGLSRQKAQRVRSGALGKMREKLGVA